MCPPTIAPGGPQNIMAVFPPGGELPWLLAGQEGRPKVTSQLPSGTVSNVLGRGPL